MCKENTKTTDKTWITTPKFRRIQSTHRFGLKNIVILFLILRSLGCEMPSWLPEARVVKAFNIVGNTHMVDPDFPKGKPDMFICGNDSSAKQIVGGLIQELGWPPAIDLGDITKTRYLEPMAMVWITHLFNNGFNINHAFNLLRK